MTEVVCDNYFFLHNTEIEGKHIKRECRYIFISTLIGLYVYVWQKVGQLRNIRKSMLNVELFIFVQTKHAWVQYIFFGF